MSVSVLYSRAISGMDAPPVTVEAHLANGLPSFTIVGLPDTEVKEAKDRVRAALQTARFEFPARRITVNLAPADLPKESGRFDLPIALGILAATKQIPGNQLSRFEFAGELALTGDLRPIRGALAMTYSAHRSGRAFVLPEVNAAEAALVRDAVVYPASTLLQVCAHLTGSDLLQQWSQPAEASDATYPDMSEVIGQAQGKRALEVAAAGAHSVLMSGPPGTGKTMLASRLPSILPSMTEEEALESAAMQSVGSNGFDVRNWKKRSALRITRLPVSLWSVAGACRDRVRFPWRCTVCCSWTSFRSSAATCSKYCASRSNPAASRYRGPPARPTSLRAFSSLPR
jgi:magnesium chelatase family protein